MADLLPFPPLLPSDEPPPLPDAAARSQALDIRGSFIVEAPAGSGKTGLLIQRYLKLLADPSVTEPEQVLAITFTRKATAELRDRVLSHLEAARCGSTPQPDGDFAAHTHTLALAVLARDRQLGWSLLDRPHRLNLRTIDAVCVEIARTLPVLSGSGGRLAPIDDAGSMYSEAARRTLLLLGTGDAIFDAALRDLLLHRDGNLADCESLIAGMLAVRDHWAELVPISPRQLDDAYLDTHILPRLERALAQALCAPLTRLAGIFPQQLLAELTALASSLGHAPGYNAKANPIALCAGIDTPPGGKSAHLEHWKALAHLLLTQGKSWRKEKGLNANTLDFEYDRTHPHHARLASILDRLRGRDDLLEALCEVRSLPPARYPADQWAVAKSLFRILGRALVELQFVFAAHNQCDFTELNLLARHALEAQGGSDDLASALGARLQHLLVDEMQDTSTSQYQLIELLTASWDGHSQTVFLVGDPRQSIYLFRQARVERFIHAMETGRLGELSLTRLRLSANFRSQRTLVEQFNDGFALIFPNTAAARANPLALPYTPAASTLKPSAAAGTVWHTQELPASSDTQPGPSIKLLNSQREAEDILAIVRAWLARPLPPERSQPGKEKPWKLAVLVGARSHLVQLVAALRDNSTQRGPIPFRAVEIDVLEERQEVLDLTALTRALLHPADRVAALAILRAPWCGLSLADLHALTGADDPTLRKLSILRLMETRGHLLPAESRQRMTRVWNVLQAAAARRGRLTTAQLVERAWRSLGGDAWLTAAQLANARRFFQLLDELEAPGIRIDLTVLESRLRSLYAEPEAVPPGSSFLELLTIHNAKGLEWDLVLVPALERPPAPGASRLLTWAEIGHEPGDSAAPILLAPVAGRGEPSRALNQWLRRIHSRREAAERKRLFYVACTRARHELHLFASPQLTSAGNLSPAAGSLLKAAWAAAQPHFLAARARAQTGPQSAATPPSQRTLTMPPPGPVPNLLQLAAAAAPALQRLPASFDPAARFAEARSRSLPSGEPDPGIGQAHRPFSRPEGSFAARAFGNAVHACLEMLAERRLNHAAAASLLAELPSWNSRIAALLRAHGLPRPLVVHYTRETLAALENTLRYPDGLWLLEPHHQAKSEFDITAWPQSRDAAAPASVRIDRCFHAGPQPQSHGEDFLWIVDYKTASHGSSGLEAFLADQRAAYAPQLEAYARILAPARSLPLSQVRLALYFPAIPRLIFWQPAAEQT
jgi:ATP-dependent exoDNAse (exonuclease V) beta subunit